MDFDANSVAAVWQTKQKRTIKWVQHAEITPEIEQKTRKKKHCITSHMPFSSAQVCGDTLVIRFGATANRSGRSRSARKMGIEAAKSRYSAPSTPKCKDKSQQHEVWRRERVFLSWNPIISQVPSLYMLVQNKADHYIGINVLLGAEQQQKTTKEENTVRLPDTDSITCGKHTWCRRK